MGRGLLVGGVCEVCMDLVVGGKSLIGCVFGG